MKKGQLSFISHLRIPHRFLVGMNEARKKPAHRRGNPIVLRWGGFILTLLVFFWLKPGVIFAQVDPCPDRDINNPVLYGSLRCLTGVGFMNRFLPSLITVFFIVAVVVAFIFLIIGGIKWITSGDDKDATAKARDTITAAIVGLVLVFLVYAILRLIDYFFHINLITIDVSPLIWQKVVP